MPCRSVPPLPHSVVAIGAAIARQREFARSKPWIETQVIHATRQARRLGRVLMTEIYRWLDSLDPTQVSELASIAPVVVEPTRLHRNSSHPRRLASLVVQQLAESRDSEAADVARFFRHPGV